MPEPMEPILARSGDDESNSAVTVDGQPVKLHEEFENWKASDLYTNVPLPPLAPGRHAVKMEVSSPWFRRAI